MIRWRRIHRAALVAVLLACATVASEADADNLRDPFASDAQARRELLQSSFEIRAMQYDLDWTWVAAVAFQESGFNAAARGPGGHVGVMQISPATAASVPVAIPTIDRPDDNIHAGVRYLRFIIDKHFSDPNIPERDRMLMAVAAYQAGPLNIDQARGWALAQGLDPDRWDGGVEIAVRQLYGSHTPSYVEDVAAYRDAFDRAFQSN